MARNLKLTPPHIPLPYNLAGLFSGLGWLLKTGTMKRGRGERKEGAGKGLSDLERQRELNIRENEAFLKMLGMDDIKRQIGQGEAQAAQAKGSSGKGVGQNGGARPLRRVLTLDEVKSKWWGREEQITRLERYYGHAVSAGGRYVLSSPRP
jgi:hypothetical protein